MDGTPGNVLVMVIMIRGWREGVVAVRALYLVLGGFHGCRNFGTGTKK